MRSPRLIYLAVAAVLAVAGFVLTQYLADRSSPGLGDTVVVPVGSTSTPTTRPSTSPSHGADPVSPGHPRTAGDDDDRDDDGIDDDLDDDD
jgi:hypothetical protein